MKGYIIRLDDACERRDISKWDRMEELLDRYHVKPLVGIIPDCQDPKMLGYDYDVNFWERVRTWEAKGWTLAMHGYQHLYHTRYGGMNPVNLKSEFAGRPFESQCHDIAEGYSLMQQRGVTPKVFFAPSHTFDRNTIKALLQETDIRIISDTIAHTPYHAYGMTFVPQQAPSVHETPYALTTVAYHPNTMNEDDYYRLERFLQGNQSFVAFPMELTDRKRNLTEQFWQMRYITRLQLKRIIKRVF